MKESFLIKVCLIGAGLGILSLFFISFTIVPVEMSPGNVNRDHVGYRVKLSGTIEDLREHNDGHIFFKLSDGKDFVDVAFWHDSIERLQLSGVNISRLRNGEGMEIIGDVELYRGSVHVVV